MEIKLYFFDRIYFVYDCQAWLSVILYAILMKVLLRRNIEFIKIYDNLFACIRMKIKYLMTHFQYIINNQKSEYFKNILSFWYHI